MHAVTSVLEHLGRCSSHASRQQACCSQYMSEVLGAHAARHRPVYQQQGTYGAAGTLQATLILVHGLRLPRMVWCAQVPPHYSALHLSSGAHAVR